MHTIYWQGKPSRLADGASIELRCKTCCGELVGVATRDGDTFHVKEPHHRGTQAADRPGAQSKDHAIIREMVAWWHEDRLPAKAPSTPVDPPAAELHTPPSTSVDPASFLTATARKRGFEHAISTAVLDYAGPDGPGRLHTRALDAVAELGRQLAKAERSWVIAARMHRDCPSWAALAAPLGVSKQALQKKHAAAVDQALTDEAHGWKWWWRHDNGTCAACRRPLANPNTTNEASQDNRKRQHQLTTGELVSVCNRCKTDPAKLHTIETDPLV